METQIALSKPAEDNRIQEIRTLPDETCATGFVRAKKRGGRTYYYLVRNNRQGDKVRQQIIAYLGHYPSLEEAIAGLPDEIKKLEEL